MPVLSLEPQQERCKAATKTRGDRGRRHETASSGARVDFKFARKNKLGRKEDERLLREKEGARTSPASWGAELASCG